MHHENMRKPTLPPPELAQASSHLQPSRLPLNIVQRGAPPNATEQHVNVPFLRKEDSSSSNNTGASPGRAVDRWFDRSNERPEAGIHSMYGDDEPPYLLNDTGYANSTNGCRPQYFDSHISYNGSEFSELNRIVIDDLTVKNRRLRERLRKYESPYNPDLDKDRALEIKIHRPMRPKQRRALEEALRIFASSMDDGDSDSEPKPTNPSDFARPTSTTNLTQSSSQSPPGPAVFDNSNSSTRASPITTPENVLRPHSGALPNSPKDGPTRGRDPILPRDLTELTEKERKKLVVQRLEALFTGRVIGIVGDHKHMLQQQEISRPEEGAREAFIKGRDSDNESTPPMESSSSGSVSEIFRKDEQRSTQPLDLDPDRAQIPSENIAHIKHLRTGLSTPQLETDSDSHQDAEHGSQGWMYLNVLYGMAQLHHINVSYDFIQSAVAEFSDKFQLHPDGKRIRWLGGTTGTHLSSDSDSYGRESREGSGEPNRKYRKRAQTQGQFSSTAKQPISGRSHYQKSNPLHYKPLFPHPRSDVSPSPDNSSDSSSPRRNGMEWQAHFRSQKGSTNSSASSKRRREEGPIVFYSGAQFCTDLSGDRGGISTPLHDSKVGNDGFSTRTTDVVGSSSGKNLPRTPSGSDLPYRPFRAYSMASKSALREETRPSTAQPEGDSDPLELNLTINSSSPHKQSKLHVQDFPASGLGGTKPADHFRVTVTTRRRKTGIESTNKRKFPSNPKPSCPRFIHTILKEALDTFRYSEQEPATHNSDSRSADSPFVKTEILSAHAQSLKPSQLPPPTGYYAPSSCSSDESMGSDSSSRLSVDVNHSLGRAMTGSRKQTLDNHSMRDSAEKNKVEVDDTSQEGDVSGEVDDDDDESIDMLAHARKADPQTVAAQEQEFEMEGGL
ncbi:hypothetical protein HYALB_00000342 [Hymenoscyphus albidus]|uniref:Frequency clock protein n=1 Tax=Hymenoscyphus albidus TaxID=595503 RepID=A0A9N9Q4T0_9HELO|nr:hypothetical protein HYALB_00000342 [Hymenoscyphus albidus]